MATELTTESLHDVNDEDNHDGSEVERIHNSAKHNEKHCIAEWKESTRL